jgi:hypothetical protein
LTTREGVAVSFRCRDKEESEEERVDGTTFKPGYGVRVVPMQVAGGKIRLEVTLEHTVVATRTRDRFLMQSGRNSYVRTLAVGEVCKLRWGNPQAAAETWVELRPRIIEP